MPDTATLARRDGIELVRTGRWSLSSGVWDASRDDLIAAMAALACPAIQQPHLKIGHTDKRFTPGDGEPTLGWFENLRLTDGGHTLLADQVAPSWLSDIQAAAWPNRSVEGTYNKRCGLGHTHPFVLTAVSLLGVTPPGVSTLKPLNSLNDVKALYGLAASADPAFGEVRIAASVSASPPAVAAKDGNAARLRRYWSSGEGGIRIGWGTPGDFTRCVRELSGKVSDPQGYCAELHHDVTGEWPGSRRNASAESGEDTMPNPEPSLIDRVREAFNQSAPERQWIVEAADDHVIVIDDADRSLHRVPVTVDGDTVSFGVPTPVRSAYVPVDERVAASVVFASRDESRPTVAAEAPAAPVEAPDEPAADADEPPLFDLANDGLETAPEDAPPAVVEPANPPAAEPDPTNTKEERVSDDWRSELGVPVDADDAAITAAIKEMKARVETPAVADPEQVAAAAQATAEADELRKEVQVLASQVQTMSGKLAAAEAEKSATVKASVLDEAQKLGKFTPADRAQWETDYDAAPAAITRVLASIAPGTAVPVQASGEVGAAEPTGDSLTDADYERFFASPKGV